MLNIAVIGATGAIGGALVEELVNTYPKAGIHAISRTQPKTQVSGVNYHALGVLDEATLADTADLVTKEGPLDLVLVTTGILHGIDLAPEKSLRDLSADKFEELFAVNTILPALCAKIFIPKLKRKEKAVFAALSARVGSISDNRLGGWYAYRASKAALNMIIKTAAIETARRNKLAVIVGLHPGTVDSPLSQPFQRNVADGKLFTPTYSAARLLAVIAGLTSDKSGKCFAWDGAEITP